MSANSTAAGRRPGSSSSASRLNIRWSPCPMNHRTLAGSADPNMNALPSSTAVAVADAARPARRCRRRSRRRPRSRSVQCSGGSRRLGRAPPARRNRGSTSSASSSRGVPSCSANGALTRTHSATLSSARIANAGSAPRVEHVAPDREVAVSSSPTISPISRDAQTIRQRSSVTTADHPVRSSASTTGPQVVHRYPPACGAACAASTRSSSVVAARGRVGPPRDDLVEQAGELVVALERLLDPPAHPVRADRDDLVAQVAAAALLERPLLLEVRAMRLELLDELLDALAARGLGLDDRHAPPVLRRERQDAADLADHRVGQRVVGLVDDDDVRDLHDARLQRLHAVAGARDQHEHDRVGVVDDVDLRLPDADGLEEDVVLAARVHEQRGLERRLAQPAERAAVGHRADEDAGVEEVLGQPDAVAEQRAVGERRGGIDREDADLPVLGAAGARQRRDQRRLAGAGRAGEAHEHRLAGVRIDLLDDLPAAADRRSRPARWRGPARACRRPGGARRGCRSPPSDAG